MNQLQEEIIKTVQYIVKEKLSSAPFARVTTAKIVERTFDSYTILLDNEEYYDIHGLNEYDSFEENDLVYVVIQNNNYTEKFILGKVNGSASSSVDKEDMPEIPVQIIRENNNPKGRAERFNYAFEGYPLEKRWTQVLHRNSEGKVIMISNHYYDNTVEYLYLIGNSADRVEYYGKNSSYEPIS